MTISSQDDSVTERTVQRLGREAVKAVNNVHRVQVNSKRPTPLWGDDIVQSSWKREAVLKLLVNKVEKTQQGCWEWVGGKTNGYGSFRLPDVCEGAKILAHRASWVVFKGKAISDGLFVCHHCDNPKCFNPDHLFLGTQMDNIQDCKEKGRLITGTASHFSKYDDKDLMSVVELLGEGKTGKEIKALTGISTTHISRIRRGYTRVTEDMKGKNWVSPRRKYTDDVLTSVARLVVEGVLTAQEIADICSVPTHLIGDMRKGRSHKKFMERAATNERS